jgi:DNA-binding transcriptional regulator LsrR (DeoR family)
LQTIAKITPADYPDLLAAVDAGMTQRQLADRYGCAPSLVARHIAKAKRAAQVRPSLKSASAASTGSTA